MDSHLGDQKYGYDFTVSTTQASINTTMKHFLATRSEPLVTLCYVADDDGNPVAIEYKQLMVFTQGVDPFSIEDASGPNPPFDPEKDPRITKLIGARFMMAFRARMGIPPMSDPQKVPPIVDLNKGNSSVGFNLLCSEFDVVELHHAGWTKTRWFHGSQQKDHPFIFSTRVDIRLHDLGSDYSKLPDDIQAKIKNLSSTAFSVQQLLYDFSNAGLEESPSIDGVATGSIMYSVLEQYFIGAYFTQLQQDGQPMLSASVKMIPDTSKAWQMTDFEFQANGYIGPDDSLNRSFSSLSYLCMTDGHKQQPAVPFTWNWVPASPNPDHDGVVAVNKNSLVRYFHDRLKDMVPKYCIKPITHCYESGGVQYICDFAPNQDPQVTFPESGPTILSYHHHGDDENAAGPGGNSGSLHVATDYRLDVVVQGNQIIVTQNFVIYLWVRHFDTSKDGNIINRKRVNTYTIAVGDDGAFKIAEASDEDDHDEDVTINSFLSAIIHFNGVVANVKNAAKESATVDLTDTPITLASDFVFPGGRTFTYRDVIFSDNQDLLVNITYVR